MATSDTHGAAGDGGVRKTALILAQHEALVSRQTEIENLKLLILKLRRMQFGRKSDKLDH